MLRMKWLNVILAALLMIVPLQMAFAQTGSQAHAAMAMMHVDNIKNVAMQHAGHQNVTGVPAQQSTPPCGQHKGLCLACGLCGAHCAAPFMHYELAPLIGHFTVTAAPPLLAAILAPPPPGEPPRTLRS